MELNFLCSHLQLLANMGNSKKQGGEQAFISAARVELF